MNISNLLTVFTLSRGEQALGALVPVQPGAEFEAGLALPEADLPVAIATPPLRKAAALDTLIVQAENVAQEAKVALPVSGAISPDLAEPAEMSVQPPRKPDDPVNFDAGVAYGLFALPLLANAPKTINASAGALADFATQGPAVLPDFSPADTQGKHAEAFDLAADVQADVAAKPVGLVQGEPALQAQPYQVDFTGQLIETAAHTPDRSEESHGGALHARVDKTIGQGALAEHLERVPSSDFLTAAQGRSMQAPSAAAAGDVLGHEAVTTALSQGLDGVPSGSGRSRQAPSAAAAGDVQGFAAVTKDAPQGLAVLASGSGRARQTPSAAAEGDVQGFAAVTKDAPQGLAVLASGSGRARQAPSAAAEGDVQGFAAVIKDAPQGFAVLASGSGRSGQGQSAAAEGDVLGLDAVAGDAPQGLDFRAVTDGAVLDGLLAKTAIAGPAPENRHHVASKSHSGPIGGLPELAVPFVPTVAQGSRAEGQTFAGLGGKPGAGFGAPMMAVRPYPTGASGDVAPPQIDSPVGLTIPSADLPTKRALGSADTSLAQIFAPDAAQPLTGGGGSAAPLLFQSDTAPAPPPKDALSLHANMPAIMAHLHQAVGREGHSHAELLMNPAELGRIRFDLITQGDQVQVTLSVERPETLDLLRANAEALRQEFRAAGLNTDTLNFGQWGQRAPPRDQAQAMMEQAASATPPPAVPAPYIKPVSASGLDLRL